MAFVSFYFEANMGPKRWMYFVEFRAFQGRILSKNRKTMSGIGRFLSKITTPSCSFGFAKGLGWGARFTLTGADAVPVQWQWVAARWRER
jgi:hypothetical protein